MRFINAVLEISWNVFLLPTQNYSIKLVVEIDQIRLYHQDLQNYLYSKNQENTTQNIEMNFLKCYKYSI